MKTTADFIPEANVPREELISEFERLQSELAGLIRESDGLPIHRVKIPSPFDPRGRYSVYSAFTILPAHQHRHLGQAERALDQIGGVVATR